MSGWWHISTNSEILLMALIGLAATIMEGINMNVRENIKEVWMLTFPEELFSTGLENLLKTLLCGIVIARGATVHAAIASYLLIVYPVLTEKLRIMLVMWMIVAGIRAILVNIVATCTGCVLCAAYPDIRPVCFEFAITKAIELACSVYMWVNVNDFYHNLKGKQRFASVSTDDTPTSNKNLMKKEELEIEDSFDSDSLSLSKSLFEKIEDATEGSNRDIGSINSFLAKSAVHWFAKKVAMLNDQRADIIDDAKAAEMFIAMSADDIIRLQQKLKNSLKSNENSVQNEISICEDSIQASEPASENSKEVKENAASKEYLCNIVDGLVALATNIRENVVDVQVTTDEVHEEVPNSKIPNEELNCLSRDRLISQDLSLIKYALPTNLSKISLKTSESFDGSTILGEIDRTVVVRAIYERKCGTDPPKFTPSKKIIWRLKKDPMKTSN